eukprot:TRINITY_DN5018_c0_g1_i1.p1 TRINITY_DN5018_c0_g1~~TRINITY_DN5018_c0_g1_i1.p1  ORF type:complete len:291 (-),score=59.38 TRINITY_DN5018_c0_g1_i1:71-943(-)
MILIYAAFLYRPRGLGQKAIADEEAKKAQKDEEKHARLRKSEDAESQVMRLLEIKLYEEMTVPKRIKNCYYYSCLGDIQHYADRFGRSVLRRLLKFEVHHRMRHRSIAIQDRLVFLTVGWAQWVRKKVAKCTSRKLAAGQERRAGGRFPGWLQQSALGRCVSGLADTFAVRSFIYFTGIGSSQSGAGEKDNVKTKVMGSGKRTGASGALKVDDVVQKFGLVKNSENEGGFASLFEPAKNKKEFDEVVVDAGTDPVDEDVYEEPPELQDEEKQMHPSAGTEDADQLEAHIG